MVNLDVGKIALMFPKFAPKLATVVFTCECCFQNHPKVSKYLGYFSKKICPHELSKIAQSGHTGHTYNKNNFISKIYDVLTFPIFSLRRRGRKLTIFFRSAEKSSRMPEFREISHLIATKYSLPTLFYV